MSSTRVFWGATIASVGVFLLLFVAGVPVTEENQSLEIAQVVVLVLAFLVMAQSHVLAFQTSPRTYPQNADLSFGLFLSVIPFAGAGRELNFGRMVGAGPEVVDLVQTVMGAIVLLLIGLSFWLLAVRVKNRRAEARRIFTGPICRAMYLATLMFVIADISEKQKSSSEWLLFVEEAAEFVSFMLILRAGLLMRQGVRAWR